MNFEWKVGATVYVVPDDLRWRNPATLTVSKVGRKYATLGEGYNPLRADLETGRIGDNSFSYGKAWPSKEAYEDNKRLQDAWNNLRKSIDNKRQAPDGVTKEDIDSAIAILKLLQAAG